MTGRLLFALLLTAVAAGPASTQRLRLPIALARLEPGLWQLRDLDNPRNRPAPVCLGNPYALVRIEHRSGACSSLVAAQDQASVTVHYTCRAGGYGQTFLRVETSRLAQVETQGIVGTRPFAYRAEARRIGACRPGGRFPQRR